MTQPHPNSNPKHTGEHLNGALLSEAEKGSTGELGEMSPGDQIDLAGNVLAMATEGETQAQADETVRDLVEQAGRGYADHTVSVGDAEAAALVGLLEVNQGGLRTAAAIDAAPTRIVDGPFRVFEQFAGTEATQKLAGTIEGAEVALRRVEEELTERPDHQGDSMIPVDLEKHVENSVANAQEEASDTHETIPSSERIVAEALSKTENLGVLTSVALTEEEVHRADAERSAGFQNFGVDDDRMQPFRKAAHRRNSMGEFIDIMPGNEGRDTVFYTFRSMDFKDELGRPGNMVEMCFDLPTQDLEVLEATLEKDPKTIQDILKQQIARLKLPDDLARSVDQARRLSSFDSLTVAHHSPEDVTSAAERELKYVDDIGDIGENNKQDAEITSDEVRDIASRWELQNGRLVQKPDDLSAIMNHINASNAIREAKSGEIRNERILELIRQAEERALQAQEHRDKAVKASIEEYEAIARQMVENGNQVPPGLSGHIDELRNRLTIKDKIDVSHDETLISSVQNIVVEQEEKLVAQAIKDRIEADLLPWTMPRAEKAPQLVTFAKAAMEYLTLEKSIEAHPSDIFSIPIGMGKQEHASADIDILAKAGVHIGLRGISRGDLQKAGVFFINRVGEGEQPIFGIPIEDDQGTFNVQERALLTKAEFERVYRFQQEQGMGVGDLDAADVQVDMVMSLATQGRKDHNGINTQAGHGRENKFSAMRSPFVDSEFIVPSGMNGVMFENNTQAFQGGSRRMNTLVIHLMNAHPDYPAVSEMADMKTAEWDQKYISPAEYVKSIYCPPTTEKEAFDAIQNNIPTRRERVWLE